MTVGSIKKEEGDQIMIQIVIRTFLVGLSVSVLLGCSATQEGRLSPEMASNPDLFKQSQDLYAQANYEGALRLISQAIAMEPNRADLWNGRGYMKMRVKDHPGAIHDFSYAVNLNHEIVQYRENLGVALLEAGKLVEALVEFTKAVEMNPQSDPAFNHRGLANSRLGRYEQAHEDFTTAITLNQSNAAYFVNRSVAHAKSGSTSLAKKDLNRALTLDDSLKEAYESRGLLELAEGEFYPAIQDFSKAIALGESNGLLFYNRAVALSMTGDLRDAMQDYQYACTQGVKQACGEFAQITAWNNSMP